MKQLKKETVIKFLQKRGGSYNEKCDGMDFFNMNVSSTVFVRFYNPSSKPL